MTEAPTGTRAKVVSLVLAIVAVALLAILHQHREGSRAMLASDVAIAAKNPDTAVIEAFEAATHVAPFSPYSEAGFARLREIAEDAENRGDDDLAQAAWRSIRAAEIATKGPFSTDPARRAHAEAALSRIDARRMAVTAARSPGLVRFDEGELAKRNARDPTPSNGTFLALGAGAVVAMLAAGLLARVGFAFRGRSSLVAAAVTAGALGLVAFALSR